MTKNEQITVLITEDESDLREAYAMILTSAGYTVNVAENGQVALDVIKERGDPDVILLDLRMPVMDGIDFLKAYDAPSHPNTSIVLFSNYDAKKDIDAAYDLGIDRYVLKARAAPKELIKIVKTVSPQ